jgi:hypothetical protein
MHKHFQATHFRVAAASLVMGAVALGGLWASPPATLDISNWTGYWAANKVMTANPGSIARDGDALKLSGYSLGLNAQYALKTALSVPFDNKPVHLKLSFDGEFLGSDTGIGFASSSSYIIIGLRAPSDRTIFWSQPCYAFLLWESQVSIQKYGKGSIFTDPIWVAKYSDFPAIGFKTFPIGQDVDVVVSAMNEGPIPRLSIKVNGVEMINAPDNKNGQVVRTGAKEFLIVGTSATNKSVGDRVSRSSVTISRLDSDSD